MDYCVDLDPTHSVIRLTVFEDSLTLELFEDGYKRLSQIASPGGPYAAIFDFSALKSIAIPTSTLRTLARRESSIPGGRPHVVVGKVPAVFGLARQFQMYRESVGRELEVVHSLEEAYKIVGARPEDFTQRLFPKEMVA